MIGRSDAQAMAHALVLARRAPVGINPRVGCVVIGTSGEIAGAGWHAGAGSPHAEVVALRAAGERARGGTAVVTLEPCAHRGRTGPCVEILVAAGVARVVYGRADPNPVAANGASALAGAGVASSLIDDAGLRDECDALVARWVFAIANGRPFVTWKFAATLDGRSAASDGSSRWITGPQARADVHVRRAEHDTVLIGTGTVLADDPQLTVRDVAQQAVGHQPLRAVMGMREVPPGARVRDADAPSVHLRTRDPRIALAQLWEQGSRAVWLEGGPTLAAAFLRAGLVDEVVAYLAPTLLGGGVALVADLGIASISDAIRLDLIDVTVLGGEIRVVARPATPSAAPA